MRIFAYLLAGVFCIFAASAAQAQTTTTHSWYAPYSPAPSANDRQVDLNTAIAIKQGESGTLAGQGTTVVTSTTQMTVGNLNQISVQNADGTVTIKNVADQDNKIGSQQGSATVTTVSGGGGATVTNKTKQ